MVHHRGKPKRELKVETWGRELKQGPQSNPVYGRASCFRPASLYRPGPPAQGWQHSPSSRGLISKRDIVRQSFRQMMEVVPLIEGLSQCVGPRMAITSHVLTHCGRTQKVCCRECWCSLYLLFTLSVTPGQGMLPHTFRASFPTATNLVENNPSSQTHQEVYF